MEPVTLLSILASNSIAVPLPPSFPESELGYIIDNSEPSILLSSSKFKEKAEELAGDKLTNLTIAAGVDQNSADNDTGVQVQLETIQAYAGGLMLYTSGTTSRPVNLHYLRILPCQLTKL